MKIIRFQDHTGWIHYGALQEDGSALRIEGDIFNNFHITLHRLQPARLLCPLIPAAILCIGLNYRKHAAETKASIPEFPVLFMKNPASIQNPGDPIELPRHLASEKVDYECELAAIIHKKCKNVSAPDALNYVLGYTAANDVSARDWQRQWGGSQWCRGKSFDTFCPLGPAIVTPDEIPDPNKLDIHTELNGKIMQNSNTSDMIFNLPRLIEFLSGSTTLLPGTVILTGTPEGVGMARPEPVWLKPGDVVSVTIQGIGTLTNPIVEESRT